MRFCAVRLGLLALVACLCWGCDNNPWNRQAVEGTVTFNGEPCQKGTVTLMPLGRGNTMSGGPITDGKFSIVTNQGVAPGDYGVTISIPDPRWSPKSGGEPQDVAPPKWQMGTAQTITISEKGPNKFDFVLENPKLPNLNKKGEK